MPDNPQQRSGKRKTIISIFGFACASLYLVYVWYNPGSLPYFDWPSNITKYYKRPASNSFKLFGEAIIDGLSLSQPNTRDSRVTSSKPRRKDETRTTNHAVSLQSTKLILIWNPTDMDPYGSPRPYGNDPWPQDCGPDFKCSITFNRSKLPAAEAVVISWRHFKFALDWPTPRNAAQRFVFYAVESAQNYPIENRLQVPPNYFNWTMTYRTDSNIYYPYGHIVRRVETNSSLLDSTDLLQRVQKKTKTVAWLMSICIGKSHRWRAFEELKNFIGVDIYGACGSPCAAGITCRSMIERDYYFYLAFENSVCKDYVTEKLFLQLQVDVVPIVLRRSIAAAVVPNEAFIAYDDFKNAEELSRYLKYLMSNLTAYVEYFTWKRSYKSQPILYVSSDDPDCLICETVATQAAKIKKFQHLRDVNDVLNAVFKWDQYYFDKQMLPIAFNVAFCPLCRALHNASMPSSCVAVYSGAPVISHGAQETCIGDGSSLIGSETWENEKGCKQGPRPTCMWAECIHSSNYRPPWDELTRQYKQYPEQVSTTDE